MKDKPAPHISIAPHSGRVRVLFAGETVADSSGALVLREGRYAWRLNLEAVAAAQEALGDFPDLPPSATFGGPTLLIAGGASDYVRPDHVPAVARYFPNAERRSVPGAGHWVHAERPDAFVALVEEFLGRSGGA